MKKISSILILAAFIMAWDANAQKGDKKEKELKSKQLQERSRSLGGQKTKSDVPVDPPATNADGKADTVSTAENTAGSDGVVERNKDQSGRPAKGTAPAVIQRTTSESGSPAVLSETGDGRDGTNNVQRAKPNIAGAEEPGNMNLKRKNSGERNIKTGREKIQKQEERPQADVSKDEQQTVAAPEVQQKSGNKSINSDENLSKKEKRKERRKNRRDKDKDSDK
jgi:hypothetical protein